jgi:hypothetical protein
MKDCKLQDKPINFPLVNFGMDWMDSKRAFILMFQISWVYLQKQTFRIIDFKIPSRRPCSWRSSRKPLPAVAGAESPLMMMLLW